MKVTGIIAEYNPFHNGHNYHLKQARAMTGADAVVAVISGAVTQRGEAALCDKWSRAEMAVNNGADLVLELPFAFACNSAEEFARGGISVLKGLGCVTDLVFGCESDPETLIAMAQASAMNEEAFSAAIRSALDEGLSYPAARSRALMQFGNANGHENHRRTIVLDRPNDILATEYVRQLVLQRSPIVPRGVVRRGQYHDGEIREGRACMKELQFSSATAVRRALREGRWDEVERAVPEATLTLLKELADSGELHFGNSVSGEMNLMDAMILSQLLRLGPEGVREIYGCSEGLEHRLWNALPGAGSVDGLLGLASSGRYPTARLRRLLVHSLIGMKASDYQAMKAAADRGELYVRVLGCNETGATLLKEIKKTIKTMPVYTNLNRELPDVTKKFIKGETAAAEEASRLAVSLGLRLDVRAADVCRMGRGKPMYDGSDFVKSPYIAHKNEKNHK